MRHKHLSLDLFTEGLAGVQEYRRSNEGNDAEYHRMVETLKRAVEGELTERQKDCVRLCYYEGLTARAAASELFIHESTVCRHLKKARQRLGRVLRYSFSRLE